MLAPIAWNEIFEGASLNLLAQRLSEWILGGVTRRLVNPSNRCSLLSH